MLDKYFRLISYPIQYFSQQTCNSSTLFDSLFAKVSLFYQISVFWFLTIETREGIVWWAIKLVKKIVKGAYGSISIFMNGKILKLKKEARFSIFSV